MIWCVRWHAAVDKALDVLGAHRPKCSGFMLMARLVLLAAVRQSPEPWRRVGGGLGHRLGELTKEEGPGMKGRLKDVRVRSRDRWIGVSLINDLGSHAPVAPAATDTLIKPKLTLGLLPAVLADQLNNILHDSRAKPQVFDPRHRL